jgi:general stress protein 26
MQSMKSETLSEIDLKVLLAKIEYAMLTTISADGSLVSRPLQTLEIDSEGVLWFFTSRKSEKVYEILRQSRVNIAYVNIEKKNFISISGHAELFEEQAKIDQLWNTSQLIFFPGGRDDPDLTLLKITPVNATYWDGREAPITILMKVGRAIITGQRSDIGTKREFKK